MGVDFHCGDVSFGCGYSTWNDIRIDIIKATFNYILDKFQKDYNLYKDLDTDDKNWIGEGSEHYIYKMEILKIIETTRVGEKRTSAVFQIETDYTINNFINTTRTLSHVDALIYFNIGGLFSLCNKSDNQGYYSPGNAVDICQLFDLIEPFVKNVSEDTHWSIYVREGRTCTNSVYDLFKEGACKNKKINIS